MSISLVLRPLGPSRLALTLPMWYRATMGTILVVLVAALAKAGARPGLPAWVLLAAVALGALYQDQWLFDAARGRVVHRVGLVIAARSSVIGFAAVERFRIIPHVEGTIPGSEDERRRNAAALAGGGDDTGGWRSWHKKSFLALVLECDGGAHYLVDRVPAREAARFRGMAARMADLCGKPLAE